MRLVDTDAETWGRVFATNVTGAAVATAAAVPHLTESAGKVVYLSSDAGTFGPPWPGLAAYGVSKAALETAHRGMACRAPGHRIHQPHRRGMRGRRRRLGDGIQHRLGPGARHGEFYPQWISRGCMPGQLMPVEDLVDVVHTILRTNTATSMPVVVARGAP